MKSMSKTPTPVPPERTPATSAAWAVQDLRSQGASYPLAWASTDRARDMAQRVEADHTADRREITRNPHRDQAWARLAACSLLEIVQAVIGADVAIENTFLVTKWPGADFEIPWHQDGTDRRIELDPARSVSAWLALTDATPQSGCLRIAPGSHDLGYLPYELEDEPSDKQAARRGRARRAGGLAGSDVTAGAVPVPVAAGNAILMAARLLH